jgi:hypothetical protein
VDVFASWLSMGGTADFSFPGAFFAVDEVSGSFVAAAVVLAAPAPLVAAGFVAAGFVAAGFVAAGLVAPAVFVPAVLEAAALAADPAAAAVLGAGGVFAGAAFAPGPDGDFAVPAGAKPVTELLLALAVLAVLEAGALALALAALFAGFFPASALALALAFAAVAARVAVGSFSGVPLLPPALALPGGVAAGPLGVSGCLAAVLRAAAAAFLADGFAGVVELVVVAIGVRGSPLPRKGA